MFLSMINANAIGRDATLHSLTSHLAEAELSSRTSYDNMTQTCENPADDE